VKSKTSKICHKCGREIPKDAEKCKFCGAVWRRSLTGIIASIGLVGNLTLLVFVLIQITQTQTQIRQAERRYIEDNKPVINVKVTKATVDRDTLWVFMDIDNEGKQNAGDLSWTSSFSKSEEGKLLIVSIFAETTDILAGHTFNHKYPFFSKSKIYSAEFTIVTKIIWKWRSYNIIYGDTVAYTLKRSSENATQWNAYREPKKSAVEASKALEKIQR
jgi:hypothetical protein